MKTLKYKLYRTRKNKRFHKDIGLACEIYNHCIALHKRYYKLFGKYLNVYTLQRHLTKIKKLKKFSHWKKLGSQVIQDITFRIDKGYKLFFQERKVGNKNIAPPSFCKRSKYKSVTYTQAGYKYLGENRIKIGKHNYKFSLSRPIEGKIKTMTLKRDSLGDFYIFFTVELEEEKLEATSDKIVGFDFGLRTFLTASDENNVMSPQFLKSGLGKIRAFSRQLSRKQKGSNNRWRARRNLARQHKRVSDKRRDWFFKQAHDLCRQYKMISLETLDIKSMAKRWGRKINDIAFSEFVQILEYIATKYDTSIHFCDKYFASSKTCSLCDNYNGDLELRDKKWTCGICQTELHRDKNASYNILRAGASAHGLGDIRPTLLAVSA